MMSTQVSLQAELLITRMLRAAAGTQPKHRAVVEHIELFSHALEPNTYLFGTAWVNGQVTALSASILAAVQALVPAPAAGPARANVAARPRQLQSARLRGF